jgi:hypothetical protein
VIRVTSDMDWPEISVVPEPDDDVRAAIRRALAGRESGSTPGPWADAALAEGVSGEDAGSLQQHDVCSLW